MSGTLIPVAQQRFFDANGLPLAGGFLYTWLSGTSTPTPVYQDAGLSVAHTNPIILDADGWVPGTGLIFLSAEALKTRLTDANGVGVGRNNGYSDPVASIALQASTIGSVLFVFGGEEETPITLTSYPSGATGDKTHADTTFFSIDSANLSGQYALQAQLRSESGITVTLALVNLTDAPDTPLVTVSSTSATGEMVQSGAITFAGSGSSKVYALKSRVSGGIGFAWMANLIRIG